MWVFFVRERKRKEIETWGSSLSSWSRFRFFSNDLLSERLVRSPSEDGKEILSSLSSFSSFPLRLRRDLFIFSTHTRVCRCFQGGWEKREKKKSGTRGVPHRPQLVGRERERERTKGFTSWPTRGQLLPLQKMSIDVIFLCFSTFWLKWMLFDIKNSCRMTFFVYWRPDECRHV